MLTDNKSQKWTTIKPWICILECCIYINATEDKQTCGVQCGYCYHTIHHSLVPKDVHFEMLLLLTLVWNFKTCSIILRFVSEKTLSPKCHLPTLTQNLSLPLLALIPPALSHICPVILCIKSSGSVAPLWPPGPDGDQATFPLIALALSSSFLQELPPDTSWHQIKVGHTGPSPFSQSLGTLVFRTPTLLPQQWSNQASADSGAQRRVSAPTCTLYSSPMKTATQHWLWHALREDMGCLHPAVISLREKTKVCVSEFMFVCVCGGGSEGRTGRNIHN